MNDNNRRYFGPEKKDAILREHLIEGKAVSDFCDKHTSTRQSFTSGRDNFSRTEQPLLKASSPAPEFLMYPKKIEALEQKLQRKNEVLSELLEEHTRLKKELGET